MELKTSQLKGVFEIILDVHEDNRGCFMRTYDERIFRESGLHRDWVQENHSFSRKRGTLRGLHFQFPPHAETKLVRVARGEVFVVVVDLRKGCPTLGRWESVVLSEENRKMLYVPRGLALGMCTLTDNCTLLYKMDNWYAPESQGAIKWNDADIGIIWPPGGPILSERDAGAMSFRAFTGAFGGLEV